MKLKFGVKWNWVLVIAFGSIHAWAPQQETCGRPADVYFLLDSSGSISPGDFRKELRFTNDVTEMFDTDSGAVRVGVLSFSQTVTPHIGLGEYADRSDLLTRIASVPYEGRGTNTAEALAFLCDKGMSLEQTRPDVPRVAIVLTDGMSQNMTATLQNAALVHRSAITVFVIGIGSQVDRKELEAIGSSPTVSHVFMIDNFDALDHIKENLASQACDAKPVTPAPDPNQMQADVDSEFISFGRCSPKRPLDLVFAVDTAAIGALNARHVLAFIANFSEHINMDDNLVTITTVTNGCASGDIDDRPSVDAQSVKDKLSFYEVPRFNELLGNMRLKAADGRRNAAHIGIAFVNARLTESEFKESRKEKGRAKYQRTTIFVVGVGPHVDSGQLKALTLNGGELLQASSFPGLMEVANHLLYSMCLFGVV
ncbi:COCA1-like protein [Mya arenaria]|uniref:COCA1-like protein n=1 Tax=Mya arenaria TaxID=6604 RepID=A0ABY7E3K9_MYAAR|nr:cartilage matrix protein-like [Mya arenaria]WAR03535.1 COCA1-like protein [Mya arenaria]